jgi:hypothetical protein
VRRGKQFAWVVDMIEETIKYPPAAEASGGSK